LDTKPPATQLKKSDPADDASLDGQEVSADGTTKPSSPPAEKPSVKYSHEGTFASPINLRQMLLAVILVAAFAELSTGIVAVSAMPVYIEAIGLDVRWIAAIGTSFLIVEGLMKSPFGLLGDRIGRKPLIVAGPMVSTFTSLLIPHIHNPFALIGVRILDGLGAAALWPSAFTLIGDHVPEARRASAMSWFNLSYLIGLALGPAIGGFANDYAHHHLNFSLAQSKQASFYVASIFFGLTTVIALLMIPHTRPIHHETADGEGGLNFASFIRMLKRMPSTLLMAFVTFLGIGLVMFYVKVFAGDHFHLTETQFGFLMIGPALVIAILSVPLGSLGDRIGKVQTVRLGIGLCALAFWLIILFQWKWNLVVSGSLLGIGFVMAFPAWMALISANCDPRQRGAVVGAVGTAQGLGAIVGAALSGFLYKIGAISLGFITLPAHALPFFGCALMLTVSFLLTLITRYDTAPAGATES
jgi:DHA1 family multidrug resistance protein-like MFS transporter